MVNVLDAGRDVEDVLVIVMLFINDGVIVAIQS